MAYKNLHTENRVKINARADSMKIKAAIAETGAASPSPGCSASVAASMPLWAYSMLRLTIWVEIVMIECLLELTKVTS